MEAGNLMVCRASNSFFTIYQFDRCSIMTIVNTPMVHLDGTDPLCLHPSRSSLSFGESSEFIGPALNTAHDVFCMELENKYILKPVALPDISSSTSTLSLIYKRLV